jgi:cyclic pyranopterin monophosphate synthase
MGKLSHFDGEGRARMVNVGLKPVSQREAVASGRVSMKPETLRRILDRKIEKGDVFAVARLAGILAAKKAGEMIPLCHPLGLESAELDFFPDREKSEVRIESCVKSSGKTGVEMEALAACAAAALTVYDMCKVVDRGMVIGDLKLLKKSGGKSGLYLRGKDK